MFLFNEVEEHDDVTDNHTYETHDPTKCHEPERRSHDPQCRQRAHHAKRHSRNNDERFDGVLELEYERQEDRRHRDQQRDGQVDKALHLFFFFAPNLHAITGRKSLLQFFQFGPRGGHNLRREFSFRRHRRDGDRAKLVAGSHLLDLHAVLSRRYLSKQHLLPALVAVNVQIFQSTQLGSLLHPQPRNYRNLLIAFTQRRHLFTVSCRQRRHRDVLIRQSRDVGAIWIRFQMNGETLIAPVVVHSLRSLRLFENRFDAARIRTQHLHVLATHANRNRQPDCLTRLELPHVDSCPRDSRRQ